ncbi:endonuclease/exonuclease/phosphatase family protein [Tissierella praeacuta]|uniref:endonuclease/exonuclease/phosphatase family protein n=1 Tax=Tissierella praeacuta TaxID=43131 RepID=UPI001C1186EE|nr:endonuclease/exonuclease/phosphatase family protein [Tissierella praeacuta]MBU5256838.1 endonuclease/exonuclease/phosphatase family protein [Tissierella praeacuta]
MNYLFWNTNKKPVNNVIMKMIIDLECDVIGLAEYTDNIQELIGELWIKGHYLYEVPQIGCDRIHILTRFELEDINHYNEQSFFTIKEIPHATLGRHMVVFVHLASKLHVNEYDHISQVVELKSAIEESEIKADNKKTIVVGDFNMNPFEEPMIMAQGLHSLSCRKVASKIDRIVRGKHYSMFYNPMWNFLGDNMTPPGTYYYSKAIQANYFWNTFDQVLIRPELINQLDIDSIKIVNEISSFRLDNRVGMPKLSDHYPLFFKLGGVKYE